MYSFRLKAWNSATKLFINSPLKNQGMITLLYSTDTSSTPASDNKKTNEIKQNNSRRKKPAANNTTSTSKSNDVEANAPTQEEIRQVRINKMNTLKTMGIEPFAYSFDSTHKTIELLSSYQHLSNGEEDSKGDKVSIAGRIMIRRVFGKLAFFSIQDDVGEMQTYIEKGKSIELIKINTSINENSLQLLVL